MLDKWFQKDPPAKILFEHSRMFDLKYNAFMLTISLGKDNIIRMDPYVHCLITCNI